LALVEQAVLQVAQVVFLVTTSAFGLLYEQIPYAEQLPTLGHEVGDPDGVARRLMPWVEANVENKSHSRRIYNLNE
jgi:hypothetical protein